jgi:uncharacterized metal-binding protein YceD (DUF177 family)
MDTEHGFHRRQAIGSLPVAGLELKIEAKPGERVKLATFLDVEHLHMLKADLLIKRWRGHGLRVTGVVQAKVVQTCVVTLEPVEATLTVDVDRKFLPAAMLDHDVETHELILDPEGEDPPEPFSNALDLGDIVVEELALHIDQYPRKAGLAPLEPPTPTEERPENPFAVLKLLKTDR